ncbi:hypothetical protein N7E81_12855 [Reichenbachiella carrageenanivorans]|uniref:Uncharacterized protein n=1 Tax=Reichenbachiella carrageenanivorans TaxID=2979869 RepID=A0ABY6CWF8_9BACT|nr:hypothetical protein [Reichenbachiella carrageenanivorans]UXX78247.1 hypothetical protein N7E81_12855 [Reichenbachiella carrageenanivorans]
MTLAYALIFLWFSSPELEKLRRQYLLAATDKKYMSELATTCQENANQTHPTNQGYCIMIHFLEAKHAINPYKKLSEFNKGKSSLDSLIIYHNTNIELRYLRLSMQERVPVFLGYSNQIESDEDYITTNIQSISDSSTYQLIYNYLQNRND